MKPFPGRLRRAHDGYHPYILNEDQQEWLRETFPVTENHIVARAMDVSYPTLYRLTKTYGIRKSEEGKKAIMQRQGEWHRRMNNQAKLSLLGGNTPRNCHNVRLKPYTKQQVLSRHKAVKLYGYIVYDGNGMSENDADRYAIFYDDNTRRIAQFEETCAKHGLTIKEF